MVLNRAGLIRFSLLFFVFCSLLVESGNLALSHDIPKEKETVSPPPLSAGGADPLRLSVRVFGGDKPILNLKKEHFKLFVNGSRQEITGIEKKEKSIGGASTLGRNFILSFSIPEYTKEAEKGISFFCTEILLPADSLIILTPLKSYQLEVSANREGIVRHVGNLLKTDCYLYNEKRIVEEKKLLNQMKQLMKAHRIAWGRVPFIQVLRFLDTFPRDFIKFKEDYLLPDAGKYRDTLELLELREGQRWWIHFQDPGLQTLFVNLKEISRIINYYTNYQYASSGQRSAIKLKYSHAWKRLLSNGKFSTERFAGILVGADMPCSVVCFGGFKNSEVSFTNKINAGLVRVFEGISRHSGGTAVKKGNTEQALIKIKNHVDRYYELTFGFDGRAEEKNVRVELQGREKETILVYKDKYSKDELTELLHYLAKGKVQIVDFAREESLISFSIKSYRLKETEKKGEMFGLLKVVIELVDRRGEKVYSRQKTLRASKGSLDIKLPLLIKQAGEFELFIRVYDLIANSTAVFSRRVTLE